MSVNHDLFGGQQWGEAMLDLTGGDAEQLHEGGLFNRMRVEASVARSPEEILKEVLKRKDEKEDESAYAKQTPVPSPTSMETPTGQPLPGHDTTAVPVEPDDMPRGTSGSGD